MFNTKTMFNTESDWKKVFWKWLPDFDPNKRYEHPTEINHMKCVYGNFGAGGDVELTDHISMSLWLWKEHQLRLDSWFLSAHGGLHYDLTVFQDEVVVRIKYSALSPPTRVAFRITKNIPKLITDVIKHTA